MILVDTSVWVDHFRNKSKELFNLLEEEKVVIHPFVVGELACGNLNNRHEILELLQNLPKSPRVNDEEILFFIDQFSLSGRGLGLIDIHLLASSRLGDHTVWTRDKRLKSAAEELGM
jgi:predicted nucleic acid-binding protein